MNAAIRDQIFSSYSHLDKEWLDKLQIALKPLIRMRMIDVWADTRIKAGRKWKEQIAQALARARVAVLLVTQNFLASDFIADEEMAPILEAASCQGLTVLWIPVTASLYDEMDIAEYQAAHDPARPLDSLEPSQLNEALVAIAKVIRDAANPSPSQQEAVTGQIRRPFRVFGAGAQTPLHQNLLRDLERAMGTRLATRFCQNGNAHPGRCGQIIGAFRGCSSRRRAALRGRGSTAPLEGNLARGSR